VCSATVTICLTGSLPLKGNRQTRQLSRAGRAAGGRSQNTAVSGAELKINQVLAVVLYLNTQLLDIR